MSKDKPYHREDLRGDLLKAGREYVAKNGHLGLSVRTLAQQVGVSAGAPYHHFPDRRSLLLALALAGFEDLMNHHAAAAGQELPSRERLKQMGLAFIRFSDENPHLVDLMFESELTTPMVVPELLEYQFLGHRALREPILEALPGISDEDADLRAVAYWSTVYGFASMRKKGVLHPYGGDTLPSINIAEAILERAVSGALAAE
jgi:AcrR family transcriptional regulator